MGGCLPTDRGPSPCRDPCAPDEVWDRYLRPARWPGWSPQIRSVDHDGAVVAAGSRGVVHALGGLRVPFEVLDVDVRDPADRSWTWVAGLPAGARLRLVHVVRPSARHAGGTTTRAARARPGAGGGGLPPGRVVGPAAPGAVKVTSARRGGRKVCAGRVVARGRQHPQERIPVSTTDPDRRRLPDHGDGQRHRPGRLLGRLVRPVPRLRAGVRAGLRRARRHRLRQGRHRGRARARRCRRHHLDPDPDGLPRGRPGLQPARRPARVRRSTEVIDAVRGLDMDEVRQNIAAKA